MSATWKIKVEMNPPMGVRMHWYKWHVISHPGLPPLHEHINAAAMTRPDNYSSGVTLLLKRFADKCEPWYMIWLNLTVWGMSLGGKEFDSGRVCVYGASLGLWPWVRKANDTCSSLKWIDIGLLIYPWDHGTQRVTVRFCSLDYGGNKAFSSLCQLLAPLPLEQTTAGLYRCVGFYLAFNLAFGNLKLT